MENLKLSLGDGEILLDQLLGKDVDIAHDGIFSSYTMADMTWVLRNPLDDS